MGGNRELDIEAEIAGQIDGEFQPQEPPGETVVDLPGSGTSSSDAAAGDSEDRVARITIGTDEYRVASQLIGALKDDPDLYQRGGVLVRTHLTDGVRTVGIMPDPSLRERMTRYAKLFKWVKAGKEFVEESTHPPTWLVQAVSQRRYWPGIRELRGVSDVPILRPDGTICQEPGFDYATGVLYEPAGKFPLISAGATVDDAGNALDKLLDIVGDFQFEKTEHRSAWIAGLLTPFARFAFSGPSPLFLIDANTRGAGKGLLAQVIGRIVLGRDMPCSRYSHEPTEMHKVITAIACEAEKMILLDNLTGAFGNGPLDSALTSTRHKGRILGTSQNYDGPLVATWYATGNNVAIAADTARRIIHIRLDVMSERPEEREDFKYPDLLSVVAERRRDLVAAALTILAAYCREGQPKQKCLPYGSFEQWSRLVREALIWIDQPDPCLTRASLEDRSDSGKDALDQLLMAWLEYDTLNAGMSAADLLSRVYASSRPVDDASNAIRTAIEAICSCPPGRTPSARQFGNRLRSVRRRVCRDLFFDSDPNEYSRLGTVWRVFSVGAGAKKTA